jgi:hypothetical protein
MSKDDAKSRKAILERRARFMAAALAASGCQQTTSPTAPDAGDAGAPQAQQPRPRACFSFSQHNTYYNLTAPQLPDSKKK